MAAFSHSRCYRERKADWATGCLRGRRRQYLEHGIPVQVNVCIRCLGMIVVYRVDDESVVCMDISIISCQTVFPVYNGALLVPSFIHRMRATGSPQVPAVRARIRMLMAAVLRSWRKREIHEMGD